MEHRHKRNYGRRKKRKKMRNYYKNQLIDDIQNKDFNDIWLPNKYNTSRSLNIPSHSWFNIFKKNKRRNRNRYIDIPDNTNYKETSIKCKKVIIYPNDEQRETLLRWMSGYTKMYNETLRLIKKNMFNGIKISYNWKKLRTHYLKQTKVVIMNRYGIKSHMLDGAIKSACSSYKSALTNLRNGHITHFRIRYLKDTKPSRVLDIEKQYFAKNKSTFCSKELGDTIKTYNNFDLSEIKNKYGSECKLHYNKKINRFTLLVPLKEKTESNKRNNLVSIDPGIRTYLTGISENHIVEIGTNLYDITKKELDKIDKMNISDKNDTIKKKYENKKYEKIKNRIVDLHWKSIKYLTNNYGTILIGKWSTKNIVNKKTSVLSPMLKRVSSMLAFYKFMEKLKYKCNHYRIHFIKVHEGYTSVLCSNCGNEHRSLGGKKRYKCNACKMNLDRDINGARNIYIKGKANYYRK